MHERSGVPPLNEQRVISTCTLVYQGLNRVSTPFINDLLQLTKNTGNKTTRFSVKRTLEAPRVCLETCKKNITYRGPSYYNRVSFDVRDAPNHKVVKHRLKQAGVVDMIK